MEWPGGLIVEHCYSFNQKTDSDSDISPAIVFGNQWHKIS